jgi:hypothetical protein
MTSNSLDDDTLAFFLILFKNFLTNHARSKMKQDLQQIPTVKRTLFGEKIIFFRKKYYGQRRSLQKRIKHVFL